MKGILTLLFMLIIYAANAQDKMNYTNYNKLTVLQGTDYVIASVETRSKMEVHSRFLLFINTVTGHTKQIDFPKDAILRNVEQIKLDTLNINKVIVLAHTVNLDGSKSIDWGDPQQLILLSTDGNTKIQITKDDFFIDSWALNRETGVIVITGYHDTNNNGRHDKKDKNDILLFDLKKSMPIKRS